MDAGGYVVNDEATELTRELAAAVADQYAAVLPEEMEGERELDGRADL